MLGRLGSGSIINGRFCTNLGRSASIYHRQLYDSVCLNDLDLARDRIGYNAGTGDLFFSQLPRIAITPIAGIIVDRFPRKQLILLGDVVAAVGTLMIGLLFWQGLLQLWHLYIIVTLYGCFGQLQTLAYSTSIALLVSKENYTRAESMVAAVGYSGAIFSPILAGSLYPIIGLTGIITVDLSTFGVAFLLLVLATIPHPKRSEESASLGLRDLTFGFRYIWSKPGLMAMVIAFSLFAIPSDLGKALYNPMILARSGGDAQILGLVTTAAGIGGVLGALAVSVSGGFKRRIDGMLIGFIATGLFKIALALGQAPWMWMFSHFAATLAIPLFYSSSNAIWYAKVPPELQGRVLAADQMIGLGVGAIAPLIAGPLADQVFEPMMQSQKSCGNRLLFLALILARVWAVGWRFFVCDPVAAAGQ